MTDLMNPAEIAALARVTERHMRRVISQFGAGPWHGRDAWRGAALRIHPGPLVEFSSLPDDVRDAALVARHQLSLPLPPPRTVLFWNGLRAI